MNTMMFVGERDGVEYAKRRRRRCQGGPLIELSVAEVVDAIKACPKGDGPSYIRSPFPSVSIDSRTIRAGECFIAVAGQQFDGHDFVEEALKKGASTIIFSENSVDFSHWRDRAFLQVEDPEVALQALARHVRKRWGKPLLAISGSTGKNTTREFITTLLSQKFKVVQSPRNLNNQIGVPLSLLQLMEEHQVALLELGMNHAGEIRALTKICNPDSALLTNVTEVHLEFFSDLDAIAAAKGEILEGLPQEGKFFFNADDSRLSRLASHFSGEKVSFGLENEAGVRVSDYRLEGLRKMSFAIDAPGECFTAAVPFVGKHFLYNIAAAVAVAVSFGLTRKRSVRASQNWRCLPCVEGSMKWEGKREIPSLSGTILTTPIHRPSIWCWKRWAN